MFVPNSEFLAYRDYLKGLQYLETVQTVNLLQLICYLI